MNQDQARRMAEEVELPFTKRMEDAPASGKPFCLYTPNEVREAIAAALVKLTQGQEPVARINDKGEIDPTLHGVFALKPGMELYTHHIPSQQEERTPLTEGTAAAHLHDLVEALDGAFISSWQSTHAWKKQLDDAREYLKEKQ